jgi:hypothetical protein
MIHNHWLSIAQYDSYPLSQHRTTWFNSNDTNHGVLCWVSGCESCCGMLSQWQWIMVRYAVSVLLNHGVLCWDNGYESYCAMLSQWLWIIVWYAESVLVSRGALWWASSYESCCVLLNQWFWIMLCYATDSAYHTMIHNHWLSIAQYDSYPLSQHRTPWFNSTDTA